MQEKGQNVILSERVAPIDQFKSKQNSNNLMNKIWQFLLTHQTVKMKNTKKKLERNVNETEILKAAERMKVKMKLKVVILKCTVNKDWNSTKQV